MNRIRIRNRQKTRPVNLSFLRQLARTLLIEFLPAKEFELDVHLVRDREMEKINREYLGHSGSTDVITFAYAPPKAGNLHGEIVICMDTALLQARQFRTTWQKEIVRYLVHGILHLQGYDDMAPAQRRLMKKEENRVLARLARRFALSALEPAPKLSL